MKPLYKSTKVIYDALIWQLKNKLKNSWECTVTDYRIPSIAPKSLSIMLSCTNIVRVCYEASNINRCNFCGDSDIVFEYAKKRWYCENWLYPIRDKSRLYQWDETGLPWCKKEWPMSTLFLVIYNLTILAGTVFLIVEYDWNVWWMLLALFLLGTSTSGIKEWIYLLLMHQ